MRQGRTGVLTKGIAKRHQVPPRQIIVGVARNMALDPILPKSSLRNSIGSSGGCRFSLAHTVTRTLQAIANNGIRRLRK